MSQSNFNDFLPKLLAVLKLAQKEISIWQRAALRSKLQG